MKITTDYMVGNTAIQIINTGKKIKIVDVEKEKKKKHFLRIAIFTLASSAFILSSCFYIVNLHSTSTMLDKENFALRSEIDKLERENTVLIKETESVSLDYKELYRRAKKLGMRFPSREQVYLYDVEKSTAIRINTGGE